MENQWECRRKAARHRAGALLTAAGLMAFCWCFFRLPHGNLQSMTFCILSASVLFDLSAAEKRILFLLKMAATAGLLQFEIGLFRQDKILLAVLPPLTAWWFLRCLPRGAGCVMSIAGYLAFFAPGGFLPALDRLAEMAIGLPVVLAATALFHSSETEPDSKAEPFTGREATMLALLLMTGTWISEAAKMAQGPWIMLTILFICQFAYDSGDFSDASLVRIAAVPVGLLLGGVYMGCVTYFNYRCVWLLILFGALGFYQLYLTGSYFLFTVWFMMAFSVYADWSTGDCRRFHFAELLFWRSIATVIGAGLLVFFRKSFLTGSKPA